VSHRFDRRDFLRGSLLAAAATQAAAAPADAGVAAAAAKPFALEEASLKSLQEAMASGKASARSLTQMYLARIEALNTRGPQLRAFIETNPDALAEADALDKERKEKGPRGPLHGIPVALKDNIDTVGPMQTTAGSLALEGVPTLGDAPVVTRLREAGAVILGKTNLSEWANIRSEAPTSGWSARGGLTRNPYALDRTASGSSSGSAVAVSANLCAVAVGTETDGSVTHPASICGVVGIKPTVGLVSRTGIIPISTNQDTAGPLARTVEDAAALLTAMASVDPADKATQAKARPKPIDYAAGLSADALKGARLGVVRSSLGKNMRTAALLDKAAAALEAAGATVVDKLKLPKVDEAETMAWEFKAAIAAYLTTRRPESPHKSLADLIAFNVKHAEREMPWFQQEFFERAQKKTPLTDPAFAKSRAKDLQDAKVKGIDALLAQHKLDALVTVTADGATAIDLLNGDNFTGSYGCQHASIAGYPSVSVPMGDDFGLPVGLLFFSRAWSEAQLLGYAFAFEQATRHRKAPQFLPSVKLG
jgi:amidase